MIGNSQFDDALDCLAQNYEQSEPPKEILDGPFLPDNAILGHVAKCTEIFDVIFYSQVVKGVAGYLGSTMLL